MTGCRKFKENSLKLFLRYHVHDNGTENWKHTVPGLRCHGADKFIALPHLLVAYTVASQNVFCEKGLLQHSSNFNLIRRLIRLISPFVLATEFLNFLWCKCALSLPKHKSRKFIKPVYTSNVFTCFMTNYSPVQLLCILYRIKR